MAKKKLKKIEHRERPTKLGIGKPKKKFANCSFRLGVQDRQKLAEIAANMDEYSNQKKITMTDALRAIINLGYSQSGQYLLDNLGRTL
jgi:hypothetical protein